MRLETEGRIRATNATEDDIRQAFLDDAGRGEFIILSRSDEVYIQAANEDNGPFTLEFRDGNARNHFQTVSELPKPKVERTFLQYLAGDESWRTAFPWRKLEFAAKPWWKFWWPKSPPRQILLESRPKSG